MLVVHFSLPVDQPYMYYMSQRHLLIILRTKFTVVTRAFVAHPQTQLCQLAGHGVLEPYTFYHVKSITVDTCPCHCAQITETFIAYPCTAFPHDAIVLSTTYFASKIVFTPICVDQ